MKCVLCYSEDIEEREVEEELKNNSDIILVPVKVLVCLQCGERYYTRATMKYLEDFEKRIQEMKLIEVGKIRKAV